MSPRAITRRRPSVRREPAPPANRPRDPLELLGTWAGGLLAPLAFLGSALRRARLFHPVGVTYAARVRAIGVGHGGQSMDNEYARSLPDLSGPALVRLSGALWRRARLPDVLGCAIRIGRQSLPVPGPVRGDQDLLFATIPGSALLTPVAPLLTDARDFLSTPYYALGWFQAGAHPVELRLLPVHVRPAPAGHSREERLAHAVRSGQASLQLEARPRGRGEWAPLAVVTLEERVLTDDASLWFDPFQDGRGYVPRGFLQSMRRLPYRASRAARMAGTARS